MSRTCFFKVLVSPNPATIEHLVLERRLSQLSANENEVFPDLPLTRSPRSNSVRRPSLNPPVISNPMPNKLSPKNSLLLAPPTQEQLAQRRFSEVNAAIERHNMRKAAKRSQSVMYRPGQMPSAGGSAKARRASMRVPSLETEHDLQLMRRRRSVKMWSLDRVYE